MDAPLANNMADTSNNSSLAQTLARFTPQQMFSMLVVVAAFIAIIAGAWMWGQTPDYRVLYSNLSDRDGGAIIESLQQQNIPYKFAEGGGALLVPANQVHEVRLRLASQGLPKGGTVGFELMENQKFGTSQFLEQINYQRALEGELSRSMQTLAAVQSARVHLAIPKPSVFVKEQLKPSASVVLTLHPGRVLDPGQVNAIVHLISSSIPNMPANGVSVLDQTGNLLSANRDSGGADSMDATQLKYVRQIELDYIKRIEDIIAPLTGAANVRAQVTADIDFSLSEQTAETYKPNQPPNQAAIRSTQTVESSNGVSSPGGVPGALSNQPPVPATAPIVAPAGAAATAAAATPSSLHKEATTNYEVDHTIRHTKLPVGSIKRLSVAVVMNNRTITDKSGKTTSKPFTESEKAQISTLVKSAMGFDDKRGDTLNLLNSSFSSEMQETMAEIPLWKQPETISLAKDSLKYLLIGGILLFLLFGILRPAFRNLMQAAPVTQLTEASQAAAQSTKHIDGAALYGAQQAANSYESNLQTAKQIAQQDPKIVATVVKEWVNAE